MALTNVSFSTELQNPFTLFTYQVVDDKRIMQCMWLPALPWVLGNGNTETNAYKWEASWQHKMIAIHIHTEPIYPVTYCCSWLTWNLNFSDLIMLYFMTIEWYIKSELILFNKHIQPTKLVTHLVHNVQALWTFSIGFSWLL